MTDEEIKATNGESKITDVLDSNYPLMIMMRERAPGTLMHSKNISLILESIGAELKLDVQKLRIASHYHDIGKTVNPKYYTENQADDDGNPHDNMDPLLSTKIITSHVGDTTQILINDPCIPRDVIEWCSQHHGTTILRAFANKSESQNVDQFRYKCSRPKTIEAMLLMLCDHLEARCRSLNQSGKLGDVSELVELVFQELLEDEQFDDVSLPKLGDLRRIKELIKREMKGQYHKRVDYDTEKENGNGNDISGNGNINGSGSTDS